MVVAFSEYCARHSMYCHTLLTCLPISGHWTGHSPSDGTTYSTCYCRHWDLITFFASLISSAFCCAIRTSAVNYTSLVEGISCVFYRRSWKLLCRSTRRCKCGGLAHQCCEIQIKYYSEAQWPPSGQTRYCWLVWLMRLILSAYPLITKQFPTCAKKYLILINSQLLYHILTLLLSVNDFCEPVYIQSTAAQRF